MTIVTVTPGTFAVMAHAGRLSAQQPLTSHALTTTPARLTPAAIQILAMLFATMHSCLIAAVPQMEAAQA